MTFRQLGLWWALNRSLVALIAVLLSVGVIGFILMGGMSWAFGHQGPSERVEGVVQSFGMAAREEGSYRVMVVNTADGRLTVRAPIRRGCQVGDRAILSRTPIRIGANHALRFCEPARS